MNVVFEWQDAPPADFAVIGDPVAHSRSPQMHAAAYRALGLDLTYVAVRVSEGKVSNALDHLRSLGYRGVNVTIPHKAEAMEWVTPDVWATKVGVVNTVDLKSRRGTNSDAPGFLDTIGTLRLTDKASVLIVGAGGSARAVAAALPKADFDVFLWNRTPERAKLLAKEFGVGLAETLSADYDLIVNTTSVGLGQDRLPIYWENRRPTTIAYDLVYGDTKFLQEAAAHRLQTVDGKELLVAQGARSFEYWLGIVPPRDVMREAVE